MGTVGSRRYPAGRRDRGARPYVESAGTGTFAFRDRSASGCEDIERARTFFIHALGVEEEHEVRDPAGSLTRSHVRFGDTVLMLDRPGTHNLKNPQEVGGVTHLVVITVGDVDAHHARAVQGGATVTAPPSDRPWGRDYEVRDPEGYNLLLHLVAGRSGPPAPRAVGGRRVTV